MRNCANKGTSRKLKLVKETNCPNKGASRKLGLVKETKYVT